MNEIVPFGRAVFVRIELAALSAGRDGVGRCPMIITAKPVLIIITVQVPAVISVQSSLYCLQKVERVQTCYNYHNSNNFCIFLCPIILCH